MTPDEEREQRLQLHKVAIGGLALFLGFELFDHVGWVDSIGQWEWHENHSPSSWHLPWQLVFLAPVVYLFRRGRDKTPEVIDVDKTGEKFVDHPRGH